MLVLISAFFLIYFCLIFVSAGVKVWIKSDPVQTWVLILGSLILHTLEE